MDYTLEEYPDCEIHDNDLRDALGAWFLVSGDADDFIFFGENDRPHSEK